MRRRVARRPPLRLLAGCALALLLWLGCTAAIDALDALRPVATWLGPVSPARLAAVVLSMGAGAWVAREGFERVAPGLVAATGATSLLAGWMLAPEGMTGVAGWLLRHYGFALLLEMGAAWLAAFAGERLARRVALPRRDAGTAA